MTEEKQIWNSIYTHNYINIHLFRQQMRLTEYLVTYQVLSADANYNIQAHSSSTVFHVLNLVSPENIDTGNEGNRITY